MKDPREEPLAELEARKVKIVALQDAIRSGQLKVDHGALAAAIVQEDGSEPAALQTLGLEGEKHGL